MLSGPEPRLLDEWQLAPEIKLGGEHAVEKAARALLPSTFRKRRPGNDDPETPEVPVFCTFALTFFAYLYGDFLHY